MPMNRGDYTLKMRPNRIRCFPAHLRVLRSSLCRSVRLELGQESIHIPPKKGPDQPRFCQILLDTVVIDRHTIGMAEEMAKSAQFVQVRSAFSRNQRWPNAPDLERHSIQQFCMPAGQ